MNERIKQLAKQAQKVVGHTDGGYTEIKVLDQEKFAELIIKDCYSVIIKSQRGHFNPATSWNAVKEHFGVEE
jgi:hypothetical protein